MRSIDVMSTHPTTDALIARIHNCPFMLVVAIVAWLGAHPRATGQELHDILLSKIKPIGR